MVLPASSTGRGPTRSSAMPQKNAAVPMARKFSVIASEMPVRDQPVSSAIGCWNTGSVNTAPIAMQPMKPPAATITQP